MLTFTIEFDTNIGRTAPRLRRGDQDVELLKGIGCVDFTVEDQGSFVLDFYNKTPSDSIVENGKIIADTEFKINKIWVDGILLELWFKNSAVYTPRYFNGYLKMVPDALREIVAPYQFNFPGIISWTWQENFYDWYFVQKNKNEVINFLDKDPDRVWKFRGSLDPCEELVKGIRDILDL
jgi:hypothetical protein